MKPYLYTFTILLLSLFASCNQSREIPAYSLVETDKSLAFALDYNTKNFIQTLYPFTDKDGTEYLTFQNQGQNDILFYKMNTSELEFRIKPELEGANGAGSFLGYYVHTMDSIFLTSTWKKEIVIIDKNAIIKDRLSYAQTTDGTSLERFYATSSTYKPIIFVDKSLYIIPSCNRRSEDRPVAAVINVADRTVETLPFSYPVFPGINKDKKYSVEGDMSRCFDGARFVYAFHFQEEIHIASPDHKNIRSVPVKSQYIDHIKLLDDYGNVTPNDACENPNYGNLIYDEYRNVYYRIAYPATEVGKEIKGMELLMYGRKKFSIIILDKDFKIIGETLFPDYTYNSTLLFVHKEGLYISNSHSYNPAFSDDELIFRLFELQGGE